MVSCLHPNAPELRVLLIKSLSNTAIIVGEKSPVLHKLDSSIFKGGASLRSVVHDCESLPLGLILDLDGGGHGVKVGGDIDIAAIVIVGNVPGGPVVDDSFLHVEAVGIRVEHSVVIQTLRAEFDDNFVAAVWAFGEAKQVNINFEEDLISHASAGLDGDVGLIGKFTFIVCFPKSKNESIIRKLRSLDQR